MSKTKADRLTEARIKAGYAKPTDAARAFGWTEPTYHGHENGSRNFNEKIAQKYAAAFRVDVTWLLFGQSNNVSQFTNNEPKEVNEAYDKEIMQGVISALLSHLQERDETLEADQFLEAMDILYNLAEKEGGLEASNVVELFRFAKAIR